MSRGLAARHGLCQNCETSVRAANIREAFAYGRAVTRRPAIEVPGGFFHVTSRGVTGRTLFRDDWDSMAWLNMVARVVRRYRWRVFAYCAMPNHFHLVIQTPEPTKTVGMHHLNASYAQRFNTRYEGWGHVFQGRYDAKPIETDEHLLECCRYVVLNPVRAAIVREPDEWPWSSYRATAGLAPPTPVVDTPGVLELFAGAADPCEAYRRFVAEGHGQRPGRETWPVRHAGEP